MLGRVDGFEDDEAKSECDEGCKVLVRFLATERKALEALELAHKLLDTGAGSIECLREEGWPVLGRCLERDHWADATLARGRAIGFGIIAFVPHSRAGRDVGPKIKQDLKLRAVAGLTLCEVKREGASIQISLEVDLGREPAAGAAQRVTLLPPFGACGRDVGPHDGGVEHLNQVGRLAHRRAGVEEGLEHAGLAQAPEALPHGIPVPARGRQGAPRDVVDGEGMHRFEEDPRKIRSFRPLAPRRERQARKTSSTVAQSSSVIRVNMVGSSQTDLSSVTDPRTWESTHCILSPIRPRGLGRVDGFDDDEAESECDEGCKVLVRFLATERNALEALELAD